jgi:hypothetical protein
MPGNPANFRIYNHLAQALEVRGRWSGAVKRQFCCEIKHLGMCQI